MENKILLIIVMGIFFLSLISLTSGIYAGESIEVDLSTLDISRDIFYFVVGNSTNTEGMNITLNETTNNASVDFAINYKPDSFSLIFIDNSTKEIVKEVHHYSSGRTRKVYIQNETFIEVDKYIDREVYVDREVDKLIDVPLIKEIDEKGKPTLISWWFYFYIFLLICFSIGTYLLTKNKKVDEENKEEINEIETLLDEEGNEEREY